VHVHPEADVLCWGKDGVSLGSCWNKDVVGVYARVVDDPMCSRMSTKLSKIFSRHSNIFNNYLFSPIHMFGWFRCDIWSVECRGVWEFSKGVVV